MPPTFTYPGVYIEELPSGVHTIAGVATSIAAFVGWAPQGPTDKAVLVQNWSDFANRFGGLDARSLLGYSVNQFFGNGGQQAYIVRLAQTTAITGTGTGTAQAAVTITVTGGTVTFQANTPGAWGNSYGILISKGTKANTFKVTVAYAPAGIPLIALEVFDNQTVSPLTTFSSNYVSFTASGATANPANGFYQLSGGADGNGVKVPAATQATITVLQPGSKTDGFAFTAKDPGAWGNSLAIVATPQPTSMDPTGTRLSLSVLRVSSTGSASVVESFNNVSVLAADPAYLVTVINNDSNYVTAAAVGTPSQALNQSAPAAEFPPASTPVMGAILAGGNDGVVLDPTQDTTAGGGLFATALNSDGSGTGGVHLLDRVDIFNLLCVPGESESVIIGNLQKYCHDSRAFYIVDTFQGAQIANLIASGPAGVDAGNITGQYSMNSAYYFPWIQAPDPLAGNRPRLFPPCGFVAGIYAATDATRGIWKAPAGIDAGLTGESGLQFVLTDLENGSLNVQAVNCLRQFKVYGDVVWGARTLQGNDQAGSQWKYVPIRRMALFLESSLYAGTQWVVFEPNDETLWGQVRLNVGAFMQDLFLQGGFQGTTPQQAYFVKCDAENNPQSSIDQGIVNILVGFAPLFPAEFVVIQIQQIAGQLQA
jgi:Bacteriophage tail sheath protein